MGRRSGGVGWCISFVVCLFYLPPVFSAVVGAVGGSRLPVLSPLSLIVSGVFFYVSVMYRLRVKRRMSFDAGLLPIRGLAWMGGAHPSPASFTASQ